MANRAEAYDFSYFEDISSNGAVIDDYALEQPQIEEQPERKVVELPRRQELREKTQRLIDVEKVNAQAVKELL